jgi:hypothetical protein
MILSILPLVVAPPHCVCRASAVFLQLFCFVRFFCLILFLPNFLTVFSAPSQIARFLRFSHLKIHEI